MSVRTVQVGECAQVINGFAFKSDFFTNERRGLPVVRIRDVTRGRSETYYTGDYPSNAVLKNGDLLIGMDGAFNIAPWKGGCALLNQRVCKIEALSGKSDISYLRYALPVVLKRIEDRTPFVTVKHLSSKELKEEPIQLPELSEQKRIAGLLEQADRLRRTRRYALELSDTFLHAGFLEFFGDPAKNTRNVEYTTLEEELERIESGFSPVCDGPREQPNQWAVLGLGAITSGVFKPEENKLLSPDIPVRPELEVQDGDVLVTRKNTYDLVAACAYVRTPPPRLLLPDTIFRFRLKQKSRLMPVYLWGLLSFPSFKKRVQRLASGSAGSMPGISKEKFMSVCCPVPPSAQQQRFSELALRYEGMRASQHEASRQADYLFHSLLHRAFS